MFLHKFLILFGYSQNELIILYIKNAINKIKSLSDFYLFTKVSLDKPY
ncbi:hypothetical protein AM1_D0233 (plasmid) [Acaryochloris marina MBIC11017]|uniref:Uncharacterized protein n=1 Tax=Acaryochloris marina (strain MBIC 11017) TaxID=329726 RepID=A8ZNZ0_ACAM1|nr:hypothetical protein AM1_D0233 [Acaryochloris marina MBIC11017]